MNVVRSLVHTRVASNNAERSITLANDCIFELFSLAGKSAFANVLLNIALFIETNNVGRAELYHSIAPHPIDAIQVHVYIYTDEDLDTFGVSVCTISTSLVEYSMREQ